MVESKAPEGNNTPTPTTFERDVVPQVVSPIPPTLFLDPEPLERWGTWFWCELNDAWTQLAEFRRSHPVNPRLEQEDDSKDDSNETVKTAPPRSE
jgi:hypothetical protein